MANSNGGNTGTEGIQRSGEYGQQPKDSCVSRTLDNASDTRRKERGNTNADHHYSPHDLSNQAQLASSWVTPQTKDYRCGQAKRYTEKRHAVSVNDQVMLVSGRPATGSPASTAKAGQLNPAHSRWLMGLPTEWDSCGAMVIRLSRRSRKASSKRS